MGRSTHLAEAVEMVSAGRGMVVTGEFGVGTTRFARELATRIEMATRPVLRIQANAASRSIDLGALAVGLEIDLEPPSPRALRAAVDAVVGRRGSRGLVLLLDDVHHLDPASVTVLGQCLTLGGVLAVATTQPGEPWPPGLGDVLGVDRVTRIRLDPLGKGQISELLEMEGLGLDPQTVLDLGGGYPLLLRHLVDLARGAGGGDLAGLLASDGPEQLVRDRLARLGADIADAVAVVAAGAPLPADTAVQAIGPGLIEELESRNLVEVGDSGLTPVHPLDGPWLMANITTSARRRAYTALTGAALATGSPDDVMRVAGWQHASGKVVNADLARAGAAKALEEGNPALAEVLARSVREMFDDPASELILGMALSHLGRPGEAEEVLAGVESPDDAGAVRAAATRAFNLAFGLGRVDEALAHLRSVREGIGDRALVGRIDSEMGVVAALGSDFTTAVTAANSVIGNPQVAPTVLTSAYVSLTLALSMLGSCAGFDGIAAEGLRVAGSCAGDLPLAADQITVMHSLAKATSGDIGSALELAESGLGEVNPACLTARWSTVGVLLSLAGDIDRALEFADQAVRFADESDPLRLMSQAQGVRELIVGLSGSQVDVPLLERMRGTEVRETIWIDRALAWGRVVAGDVAAAAELMVRAGDEAVKGGHVVWGVMALHDVVRLGFPDLVTDRMETAAAEMSDAALVANMVRHSRVLGDGDLDGLAEVAEEFATMGAWLFAAETMGQVSGLAAADHPATSAQAAVKAWAYLDRCRGATTPAVGDIGGVVSRREYQIAADAAAGHSSGEIAARRFISVRTVDNHLGSVYRKLGVSGRDALGELLASNA